MADTSKTLLINEYYRATGAIPRNQWRQASLSISICSLVFEGCERELALSMARLREVKLHLRSVAALRRVNIPRKIEMSYRFLASKGFVRAARPERSHRTATLIWS